MNAPAAPDLIDGRYELYRVVLDYEGLQDAFADRIEDLNTTLTEIDAAGGLTRGNMQRLLASTDPDDWRPTTKRKQSRQFGWETLGKALEGTGLALVLVLDDARFAAIKARLGKAKRPMRLRQAIARRVKPAWLFSKKKARKMGQKRWEGVSDAQRSRIMKKASKAAHRKRRKSLQQIGCVAAIP